MKTKIMLDTNFLLIPGQFNVDVFAEIARICAFPYELVIVKEVADELESIANGGRDSAKDRASAKLGRMLLDKYKVKMPAPDRKVFKRADEAILAVADENSIIATQDRELRARAAAKKARLIILRQKKYLQLLGE
jgi:uncharacterized protein